MNIELVAQMFKNYQSNVLFHLEGEFTTLLSPDPFVSMTILTRRIIATDNLKEPS